MESKENSPSHPSGDVKGVEHELVEEVDIEVFAKEHGDREKPKARRYRIRIDREPRVVDVPKMTGRQILALVNMTPETHKLYELERGKQPRRIEPNEVVSFVRPGVERFQTIPLDPTEGGNASGI